MKLLNLTGRVALITGGNSGIGFAIAQGLADAGAAIVISGRNRSKNEQSIASLTAVGAKASAIEADITQEAACRDLVTTAAQKFGRLDILINNAGMNIRKAPQDYTLAEWHSVMDTNLTSAFLCAQAAYFEMKKAGGGKIINIGSMLSIFGAAFAPAYGASKGGIVQLSKSLATAWATDNIQVNAILPGWIDTDLTRQAREQLPSLNERVLSRTPAQRWGLPEDLAGIAVFLASPAANFITGAAIPVDGGYSAQI